MVGVTVTPCTCSRSSQAPKIMLSLQMPRNSDHIPYSHLETVDGPTKGQSPHLFAKVIPSLFITPVSAEKTLYCVFEHALRQKLHAIKYMLLSLRY